MGDQQQFGTNEAGSLAGISALYVFVTGDLLEWSEDGHDLLRVNDKWNMQAEERIGPLVSDAGFEYLADKETLARTADPILRVAYHATELPGGSLWSYFEVSIEQRVNLARDLSMHCWGRTWHIWGTTKLDSMDGLLPALKDATEKALGVLREANPLS